MVHETAERDPERIYLEPPPYSPEGRQSCADDVWPLDGDGPGGVEYVRADLATDEWLSTDGETEMGSRVGASSGRSLESEREAQSIA